MRRGGDGEGEGGKVFTLKRELNLERREKKGQREGKSQEQPAIITTDPPWYSIELVY